MSLWRLSLALLAIGLAGSGCTSTWVEEQRLAPTGLSPGDRIALVSTLPLGYKPLADVENTLSSCIQGSVGSIYSDVRIILPEEFRKLVFPDLTKENAPIGGFSWETYFQDQALQRRISQLGLHYLISVDVEDTTRLTEVEWGAGKKLLGAPGPVVEGSWENSALLQAIVLDIRHRRLAGRVVAYASGKGEAGLTFITYPMPLPVPYGATSFPLGVACRGMAEKLAQFLSAETPAKQDGASGQN